MNKFIVVLNKNDHLNPVDLDEDSENECQEDNGYIITLSSVYNENIFLFFPIDQVFYSIIEVILKNQIEGKNFYEHLSSEYSTLISVFFTLINSWKSAGRFLSGIIFGLTFDLKLNEEIISPVLIISDSSGHVDSFISVPFLNAIVLSCLERKEIIVSNDLLNKLLPRLNSYDQTSPEDIAGEDFDPKEFPSDKQILEIAKSIMLGKNKN